MKTKRIFFDIETAALWTRAWDMREGYPIKKVTDWVLLCFAYKIEGEKETHVEWLVGGKRGEKKLVAKLYKLFCEADVLVAHNAKFDIKKAQAKFLEYGFQPPTPYKVECTYLIAKKHFKLTSNKLNDIAILLGIGEKVKHPGFEMWEGCEQDLTGDGKDWRLMRKYNKKDVELLEKVYQAEIPWERQGKIVWNNKKPCPYCESRNTQKKGTLVTSEGEFQRHQCRSCAKWFKGDKIINKV